VNKKEKIDIDQLDVQTYNTCEPALKAAFEKWVGSMNLLRDFEIGGGPNGALQWVKDQNAGSGERGVYTTFIFASKESGEVMATASVVEDDRSMARKYKLTGGGFWALVAVRHDLRGRGIGTVIARYVDAHVQRFIDTCKLPCSFYLFTTNPVAVKIYEALGFQYKQDITVDAFGFIKEKLFEKNYIPSHLAGSENNA
jgi:GNAT superfamily N-acetyltransferase